MKYKIVRHFDEPTSSSNLAIRRTCFYYTKQREDAMELADIFRLKGDGVEIWHAHEYQTNL
jgi:hypothetical protein